MSDGKIGLIVTALQADDPGAAQFLCEEFLREQPDACDVLILYGLSLQRQGELAAATQVYARLTRLNPDSSLHWGNYATALTGIGDLDAAERAAHKAVQIEPDDADLLEQLGMLQLRRKSPRAAQENLLRAVALAPKSPSKRIHAARASSECNDYRADELLSPWREWLPLDELLQYELADALLQAGDAGIARELLEDVLRRVPAMLQSKLLLASVYERLNIPQRAAALLQQCCIGEAESDRVVGYDIMHQQAQLAMRSGAPATARALLEDGGPLDAADYAHYFVLAGACDQLDDCAAAMDALKTAHERQSERLSLIAPHCFAAESLALPGALARVTAGDYQRWPKLIGPDSAQSPVFIVGFPRSGTTLLEQMLDAHPSLQSMDERPIFDLLADQLDDAGWLVPQDLQRLKQRDCDELRKGYLTLACAKVPRRWDAQLVDKNPLNMLWLPMIHRLFPQAKFILAVRHPCDVILSCHMQNFRSAVLAAASASLPRLAEAYVAAMQSWLHHVDVFKPHVFVSRHEDLVMDLPEQARRIAAFLGLDSADSLTQFSARAREKGYIATPSYSQVIEPINRKGLDRWHRYRKYFDPLLPLLQPMIEHWGYGAAGSGAQKLRE